MSFCVMLIQTDVVVRLTVKVPDLYFVPGWFTTLHSRVSTDIERNVISHLGKFMQ